MKSDAVVHDSIPIINLNLSPFKTEKLIGEWTIYSRKYTDLSILCNQCQKVKFNNDGTMNLGFEKWTIKGKMLRISNISGEKSDNIFGDSEYEMSYDTESDFTKLTLYQIEKRYSIILGKD